MKIQYIISIMAIALMIVLSGCGKATQPSTPSVPSGEQPQAPTPEAPAAGEAEKQAPVQAEIVPEDKILAEKTSVPEGTELFSNFGCDSKTGTVSFKVTNVGTRVLTIDNGQGLTGITGGEDLGEQNDWIKIQFNGRALRKMTCGKLDLTVGETTDCSQNEGLSFRTAT